MGTGRRSDGSGFQIEKNLHDDDDDDYSTNWQLLTSTSGGFHHRSRIKEGSLCSSSSSSSSRSSSSLHQQKKLQSKQKQSRWWWRRPSFSSSSATAASAPLSSCFPLQLPFYYYAPFSSQLSTPNYFVALVIIFSLVTGALTSPSSSSSVSKSLTPVVAASIDSSSSSLSSSSSSSFSSSSSSSYSTPVTASTTKRNPFVDFNRAHQDNQTNYYNHRHSLPFSSSSSLNASPLTYTKKDEPNQVVDNNYSEKQDNSFQLPHRQQQQQLEPTSSIFAPSTNYPKSHSLHSNNNKVNVSLHEFPFIDLPTRHTTTTTTITTTTAITTHHNTSTKRKKGGAGAEGEEEEDFYFRRSNPNTSNVNKSTSKENVDRGRGSHNNNNNGGGSNGEIFDSEKTDIIPSGGSSSDGVTADVLASSSSSLSSFSSQYSSSSSDFEGTASVALAEVHESPPELLRRDFQAETIDENEIQIVGGPAGLHFVEKPPTGGSTVKSRDQIRRDLSRLSANLRTNSAAAVVTDTENANKCDRLYLSGADAIRNGTFESPALAAEEGHSLQCIYTFVARPNERVEIIFTHFNVRGTPPECVHEWVDLYTEVEDTDVSDLISTPFGGRYCGRIPPRRRISLYGGIAIGFYSDKNTTEENLFRGTYAFISEDRFVVGTPVPRTICSYTVLSNVKRQGELVSPTYPGVYPKDLSCTYKFIGKLGQRIRLEFRDFDLFFGGSHCPFDDVKIYDGMEPNSPLIGTYCGQQRNLVVYSSEHLMLVTFTTLDRNTEAQNRGFSAVWEFSESFVKLDFITKNTGEHIRGTECDQRILSKGQSHGAVYSPNYPFPYLPKIVCRYFIYGLQDPQHLERVRLAFDKFDVPTNTNSEEDITNPASGQQHKTEPARCGDGFLKIYIKGQELIQAYDKADFEFCGKEVPHDIVSEGPRLVLVFSSGETQGSGFKARYVFETEYRIPGTAAPDGSCRFSYLSASRKNGELNSPRHPSNYPSEINCTYTFTAEPNEQIRLVFDHFRVKADKINYTGEGGTYGEMCQEDYIEIFNLFKDREDRLIGRYCGLTAPGPIESREGAQALKLVLHTDSEGVSSGFKAKYIFFTARSIYGDCGRNITQDHSGVLTTPNWPAPYDGPQRGEGSSTCNWYLTVRPGSRVMLHFQVFNIEGSPKDRGCPAAAVRIWEDIDGIPVELCGEKLPFDQSQYVSTRNIMRVTFITADKAVGAGGFQAVWTEVQDGGSGASCHHTYFRCSKSQFCIPSELRCNGYNNCGNYNNQEIDQSDEEHCGIEGDMNLVVTIILGVASFLSLVVIFCVYAQRKRRKRHRRLQLRRPPIHVCDNAGARFAAMDSV